MIFFVQVYRQLLCSPTTNVCWYNPDSSYVVAEVTATYSVDTQRPASAEVPHFFLFWYKAYYTPQVIV